MNSAPADPLIGHTIDGRYVIRSRIARGGMAMVYLATDLRLERRVAVKVMHSHLVEDDNFVRRFEQEARSAARLAHPNLVGVLDQGVDRGLPYLIMEYLPSITLRELLKQQRRLTAEQALEIGEAVLAGLAAAHSADIVHRDLKPENVLLADDGRIKIGDFGLARAVSANTTTGQALLGTIAYLSPELVTRGIADERSDLYAFGIMMFEMLTGEQPFKGEQAMQIAYQHAHGEVPKPSSLAPEIAPEVDELVRWLTARDPEQRPADAGEALPHLRRVRGGGSLAATRVLPVTGVIGESVTPATAVLSSADQQVLAQPAPAQLERPAAPAPVPRTPTDRARVAASKRKRRGRWIALLLVLLVPLAGGVGWWFGQGPGSLIPIPQVAGLSREDAEAELAAQQFTADVFDCPSLDIARGLAVRTEPEAGSRVDRGSQVRLCLSSGPEMLPVPTLVDLSEDDAIDAIEEARFTFGSVPERRFDGGLKGTVILALDSDGNGLGELYPEQGRIDLIVSAGTVPPVANTTVEAATRDLTDAGLVVDSSLNTESHHDEVPQGQVIDLVRTTDPLRTGDPVGLEISLGPQLFEVPSVAGMSLQDAMNLLASHGFQPTTAVPDVLRPVAVATTTNPGAGEMVRAGATIQVRATLSL